MTPASPTTPTKAAANEVRPRPPHHDRRARRARRARASSTRRSMSPWTTALVLVGLAPRARGARGAGRTDPRSGTSRRSARSRSSPSRASASSPAGPRSTSPSSSPPSSRSSASRRGAAPRTTSRSSSSRSCTSSPGTVLGGGLSYGLCFVGLPGRRAGRARAQPPAARGRGQLPPGRARSHGPARRRPAHPAEPPRRRSRLPRDHVPALGPDLPLHGRAVRDLPARRPLAAAPQPSAERAAWSASPTASTSARSDVLRSDPSIALRFEVQDLPEPPPRALTLRLRGTAFDRYDGRRWERTQRDRRTAAERRQRHRSRSSRRTDAARSPHHDRPRADRSAGRLPAAAHRRAPASASSNRRSLGEPLEPLDAAPRARFATAGSDAHGLRYDAFVAGDREPIIEVARAAGPPALPRSPAGHADAHRAARARVGRRAAHAVPQGEGHRGAPQARLQVRPRLAVGRQAAARRPLPLRVEARALRVLLDGDGASCCASSASRRATSPASSAARTTASAATTRSARATRTRGSRRTSTTRIRGWVTFDPTPTSGAQPLQETVRRVRLHARPRRGAVAALEPLRHRLRPQDAGPHLRGHQPRLRAHAREDRREPRHRSSASRAVRCSPASCSSAPRRATSSGSAGARPRTRTPDAGDANARRPEARGGDRALPRSSRSRSSRRASRDRSRCRRSSTPRSSPRRSIRSPTTSSSSRTATSQARFGGDRHRATRPRATTRRRSARSARYKPAPAALEQRAADERVASASISSTTLRLERQRRRARGRRGAACPGGYSPAMTCFASGSSRYLWMRASAAARRTADPSRPRRGSPSPRGVSSIAISRLREALGEARELDVDDRVHLARARAGGTRPSRRAG